MSKTSFDVLKEVVDSFRHVGWVNGLSDEQYDKLNEADEYINAIENPKERRIADRATALALRSEGKTIRQIAFIMGYKHPGSISYLLTS